MSDHPSITGGLAGRYASALFDLAQEAKAVETIEADLKGLNGLIDASADLRLLIKSAVFSREDQGAALGALLKKGGAHDLTRNFVGLVTRNRRLFVLPDMIKAFVALAARGRGEITAAVTSARPLNDSQVTELKAALKKSLGRDVALDMSVDADLLGGLVVQVGSRMIDSSIRTKLNNLKIAMKEAG